MFNYVTNNHLFPLAWRLEGCASVWYWKKLLQFLHRPCSHCHFCSWNGCFQNVWTWSSPEPDLERSASSSSTPPQDQRIKHPNKPDWGFQKLMKRKHVVSTWHRLKSNNIICKEDPLVGNGPNCFKIQVGSDTSKTELAIYTLEKVYIVMTAVMYE